MIFLNNFAGTPMFTRALTVHVHNGISEQFSGKGQRLMLLLSANGS
jgi:hypothetical protein